MRHIRGRTAGFVVPLLLSISLAISWAAQARTFRESHILFGHLGGQGGTRTAPSGFKFGLGYNYRFSETLWLDISAGIAIGSLPCYTRTRFETQCGGFGGTQVEGLIGVKYKFEMESSTEFVPYVRLLGGGVFVANHGDANDGVAPVARIGAGVKYYLTDSIGIGGEALFTAGPLITGCGPGCKDVVAFATGEVGLGIDFSFD